MRQIILLGSVLVVFLVVMPVSAEEEQNERLWYQQSLDNGGDLKTWMVNKQLADEDGFTCGALLQVAWSIATKREIADTVDDPAAQPIFTNLLFATFRDNNQLPCNSLESRMTWTQFGEIGRRNAGYTPFTAADVAEAKQGAEAKSQDVLQAEQAEAAERGLVYHVPQVPTPNAGTTPQSTSRSTTLGSSLRRYPAVQMDGTIRKVISTGRSPLPTESEIADFVATEAKAEQEAREQAEREVAEAMEREAELEQLEHEIELEKRRNQLQKLQQSEVVPTSYSESDSWWDISPLVMGESGTLYRSPQEHSEAFLRSYFWDIPEMVEVASCESTFRNIQSELVDRDGKPEESFGFFQIHGPTWHEVAMAHGLPHYQTDAMQNALMARHMYEIEGLHPWRHSKDCWGPKVRKLRR